MGSRSGTTYQKLVGRGKTSKETRYLNYYVDNISTSLNQKDPERAVELGCEVLAVSNPAFAQLYLTYKMAKEVYEISHNAYEAYQKDGETGAIQSITSDITELAVNKTVSYVVGRSVDMAYAEVKTDVNVETSRSQDEIIKTVAKGILNDAVGEILNERKK